MSSVNARVSGQWVSGRGAVNAAIGNVPIVGRSGLQWNSGVLNSNGDAAGIAAFETWRGRDCDTILFFATRQQWADFNYLPTDRRDFPGLKIISIPPFPEAAGTNMTNVANGNHNSDWQAYGALLASEGWNNDHTIVRIGWESNGNWYQWAQDQPDAATFAAAFRNVVTSIRVNAPNVLFNWCVNKGPSQTGTGLVDSGYPGDAYVDILGLDHYDQYPAQLTEGAWTTAKNQVPGLESLATYARAHGKLIALDEWGVIHTGDSNGGNDNPFYITKMWDWFQANTDILAYESYYDDEGSVPTFMHDLSQGRNPNAAAAYLSRWGN